MIFGSFETSSSPVGGSGIPSKSVPEPGGSRAREPDDALDVVHGPLPVGVPALELVQERRDLGVAFHGIAGEPRRDLGEPRGERAPSGAGIRRRPSDRGTSS